MNVFDYLFENSRHLNGDFIQGSRETISYKDLYDRSVMLAGHLNSSYGNGRNILLIAPNSVFFIIAYLGILKSGNVVVPLSTEIETANLDFILEKCQSPLIITTQQASQKLQLDPSAIMDEKAMAELLETKPQKQPQPFEAREDQLAEIIFTSGSTGVPKGVMISHKNIIANTSSILEYLKLTEKDVMLVVLPFYYCYGLSLLHTHLRAGGSLVLNNMFVMLGGVINDLKNYGCTGFAGVPSHFQILLRKSDSFKKTSFPSLRYMTQAGGKLHNAFISEFLESHSEIQLFVMYGQTEATARLSWLPPEQLPGKIGSCGKAIPGVQLVIADESGNPVKPGETGEILAYGDNIMTGYYKDPESTQHTVKNGWLHTGDLAAMDEEGYVYLKARIKEIIKVGGRRISPKEIEEVIVSMPGVVDCSIEGVEDAILGETMKATVVINDATTITPDSIRSWCSTRLAAYKIPQLIETRDKITITATGKKIRNK